MKGVDISGLEGNPIKEWIRAYDPRTDRTYTIGVLVGCIIESENGEKLFNADYAIANTDYDEFDPDLAIKIAYGRARKARPRRAGKNVIRRDIGWFKSGVNIQEKYFDFIERCQKYYKDARPSAKAASFYYSD
jgi:hypothetical protein